MDIHKEKVVEKKVLEEIIAVKFLLISDNEIFQLTDRDLGDHKSILIVALCDKDESKFFVVHHLEIIAAADDLTVYGGQSKAGDHISIRCQGAFRLCNHIAGSILYAKLNPCDRAKLFDASPYDL